MSISTPESAVALDTSRSDENPRLDRSRDIGGNLDESHLDGSLDSAIRVFSRVRGRLFGIAFRIVGSAFDAEDIVQEAWLRWQTCDRSRVRKPEAFLAVTTERLALNHVQSARVRYERPNGPDVVRTPVDTPDPTLNAERTEALEGAVLLLLQTLSPRERTAFVLREAFDYAYGPIADMLQLSQAAARQLVSRARRRLTAETRATVTPSAHRELVTVIIDAARAGDIRSLERVLQADTAVDGPRNSVIAEKSAADVTNHRSTVS